MGFIGEGLASLTGGVNDALGVQKSGISNPVSGQQIGTAYDQTQQGLAQQQSFVNALQAQNGIGNQSSVFNQLQGVANGQGPNPAQAVLAQQTGNNAAMQAALMAGQRGTGANAGLLARQAAMQGGNLQQQAVGQGATLQANQSLGALNQLGGIANQQVTNQAGALAGYNQAAQNQQANLLNAQGNFNTAQLGATKNANDSNVGSKVVGSFLGGAGAMSGGGGGGGGAAASPAMAAAGARGGVVPSNEPMSMVAKHMKKMASGGKVEALVSPGERYLPPKEVEKVAEGKKSPMSAGEKIPGKPKVGGAKNDYANDTVHKKLESGGVILPRSVTQSDDPAKEAHKFISAILAKQSLKKS